MNAITSPAPELLMTPGPGSADDGCGPTIDAREMTRVTGVGRERLRTWERRHGFPMPVRTVSNQRRYLASDVRHVIAIARAVERGVGVPEAIAQVVASRGAVPVATLRPDAALEHCDAPVLAVVGPDPLRVTWVNRTVSASPEAPAPGDELLAIVPELGQAATEAIQRLMVQSGTACQVIEHRDWVSGFPASRQSLAWRVPPQAADEPTVMVMQLPPTAAPGVPASEDGPWTTALSTARTVLQGSRGLPSVQRALAAFAGATGGLDALLATHHGDRLRTATSVKGAFPARALHLTQGDTLREALCTGRVAWLEERAARMLDAPVRSSTLLLPLQAGGERIGAAFVMYPAALELSPLVGELLHGLGLALGLTLQREHLLTLAEPGATA